MRHAIKDMEKSVCCLPATQFSMCASQDNLSSRALPWRRRLLIRGLAGLAALANSFSSAIAQPASGQSETPAEIYAATVDGKVIEAGRTEIDGRRMTCGTVPTVLDSHIKDFGVSGAGFIVLNPSMFTGLATPVKLWIFSHECAHQTVGADEVRADCAAVQRGKREGWLNQDGLAQVCEFMKPARADSSHFSGPQRCELMRRCYAAPR
jgi:hypothetical protein